ncbi:MAG: AAA family ATPase [Magnetococcales bacterium]|nr:AAA family ATPase [Magnetococcales bacterium]
MKIAIKNLGDIKQAEFTLGDLTIICGANNTGKTYATYALYGFLTFWHEAFSIPVPEGDVQRLLNEGSIELDIQSYTSNAPAFLQKGCRAFTENLSKVFASPERNFLDSDFSVDLDATDIQPKATFELKMGTATTNILSISKKGASPLVTIALLFDKDKVKIPNEMIKEIIGVALKNIIFGNLFPEPFIASAERTGSAIFRKELDLQRNRLLEEIGSAKTELDKTKLFLKIHTDYALPVKENIAFIRQLEKIAKTDSFIATEHAEILNDFTGIIGGNYLVTKNDELYYTPRGKLIKLTMNASSSSVRSLLDIGFYLRHIATPNNLLMIDEPELNLHPENQRRVARMIARLVNIGVKVFMTTHSDYIIKELNTLIMLNQDNDRLKKIAKREHYQDSEILDPDKVRVYIAEKALIKLDGAQRKTQCQTLVPANVDQHRGIEARSFDKTIEEMNRIQDEIIWGETDS